jgi:hypothetical protein
MDISAIQYFMKMATTVLVAALKLDAFLTQEQQKAVPECCSVAEATALRNILRSIAALCFQLSAHTPSEAEIHRVPLLRDIENLGQAGEDRAARFQVAHARAMSFDDKMIVKIYRGAIKATRP